MVNHYLYFKSKTTYDDVSMSGAGENTVNHDQAAATVLLAGMQRTGPDTDLPQRFRVTSVQPENISLLV